jgi:hypothetical protein
MRLELRSNKQVPIPNVLDHKYGPMQNKRGRLLHVRNTDEGLGVKMRNPAGSQVSP